MKYELEIFGCLCSTKEFTINGIVAYSMDFGIQEDLDSENAEPYGCGNMTFTKIPPTNDVLSKYNISVDEYDKIGNVLEDKLSFGACGWCV